MGNGASGYRVIQKSLLSAMGTVWASNASNSRKLSAVTGPDGAGAIFAAHMQVTYLLLSMPCVNPVVG